ncbi:MAG: phage major capsid protein [Planctomycetes bacterium]|nr:phage major capsid protein [Planctomycetota bacterium]
MPRKEAKMTSELKNWLVENRGVSETITDNKLWQAAVERSIVDGTLSLDKLAELMGPTDDDGDELVNLIQEAVGNGITTALNRGPTSAEVFGQVNTKDATGRYCTKRVTGKHVKTGQPVCDENGRYAETPSELDYAKAGVLLKHSANRAGIQTPLTDHERQLLGEMFQEPWCGKIGSEWHDEIPGSRAKILLDDTTSGGLEVVPIEFDAAIVQFPLLHSELLPFVDLRPIGRGRRIEGASIDNPTVTWGQAEGTALTAFDTDDLVDAIDTTIFPVSVAIEVGRDFLADSPVDVGRILVENIGQRMAAELDLVIANGNGTTQPQGIFQSGATDVGNPTGGAGATATVDDYEALMFGIDKQYRNRAFNPAYVANDTSYRRARAIPIGAADVRRVFGMDESSYTLLDWPYRIQNDLDSEDQAFVALKKYRLYRRAGTQVQWTTEGSTLALANLALLVVRGRYGGKMMDTNAAALQTNAEA